jgi:SAM-dependent methyltransferase
MKSSHLELAKKYWKQHLKIHDLVIDATCGNGHDTYFLKEKLQAEVIALDIQARALSNSKKRAPSAHFKKLCHSKIDELGVRPKLVVYNLGYLPGQDKSLTTRTESTLLSVQKALQIICEDGAVSIMCYPGHPEGLLEEKALLKFLKTLDPKSWHLCYHTYPNREKAPSLFWIERASSMM